MGIELKERYTPEAKVYMLIKDPLYGGSKRKFVELLGFKNVTTTLTMNGVGSANVTFDNHKGCLMRYFSSTTVKNVEKRNNDNKTTNGYAVEFLDKISKEDTSGQNLYSALWKDTIVTQVGVGQQSVFAENKAPIEFSRNAQELYSPKEQNQAFKVNDKRLIYALPFVEKFDPIFIDYRGQDGYWYAGFTGFVSSINENYQKTGSQTLTISCGDMNLLLDNVSMVTAWNRFASQEKTLQDWVYKSEANVDASKSAYTTIFSDKKFEKITDIILKVLDTAQYMWQFTGMPKDSGLRQIMLDTDQLYNYYGLSARRGSIQYANDDPETTDDFLNKFTEEQYTLEKKHFYYDDDPEVNTGKKSVLIDPLIMKMDQVFIHKMLSNSLSLFVDSMKSANDILNDIVGKMFAYKYFDANGNLIIELAKPNNFPNLEKYGGRSIVTAIRHESSTDGVSDFKGYIKPSHVVTLTAPSDSEDYEWLSLYFHGKNYILSFDDFIGFTSTISEQPLITVATTEAAFAYIQANGQITNSLANLKGVAVASPDLLSKLGVRRYQAQCLYNVIWPSKEAGSRVLSFQSAALLDRVNNIADAGTIMLQHRPDLQLGRTFINPLRMKSYLITGITNSWSIGGNHSTTLTLTYGKPLHKTLETPWSAIYAEPNVFDFEDVSFTGLKTKVADLSDSEDGTLSEGNAVIGYENERNQ